MECEAGVVAPHCGVELQPGRAANASYPLQLEFQRSSLYPGLITLQFQVARS